MKKIPNDISELDKRIKDLQNQEESFKKIKPDSSFVYAAKAGLRVSTELLSGVLIGAGLGYLADRFFDTKPLLLIIFIFLGFGAGFLNVYRFVKSEDKKRS